MVTVHVTNMLAKNSGPPLRIGSPVFRKASDFYSWARKFKNVIQSSSYADSKALDEEKSRAKCAALYIQ